MPMSPATLGLGVHCQWDVRHHDGTDDQVLDQFPHRGSLSGSASLRKVSRALVA